jgi:hypothetical protein
MPITNKYRNSLLNPAFAAALVAIASTAALLFDDFGPSHASQDKGAARMVTAAAVSKAGAIEIPSPPGYWEHGEWAMSSTLGQHVFASAAIIQSEGVFIESCGVSFRTAAARAFNMHPYSRSAARGACFGPVAAQWWKSWDRSGRLKALAAIRLIVRSYSHDFSNFSQNPSFHNRSFREIQSGRGQGLAPERSKSAEFAGANFAFDVERLELAGHVFSLAKYILRTMARTYGLRGD